VDLLGVTSIVRTLNLRYSATIWLGSARQSEWRVGVAARVMIAAMIVARKGFVGFVGSCR
jgi:hypothetical protein